MRLGQLARTAPFSLVPLFVLVAIWFSLFNHYWVSIPSIPGDIVEASRGIPEDALLDELSRHFFFDIAFGSLQPPDQVAIAERILQGEFFLPGASPRPIRLPFDAQDIDQGPPSWQLAQASLVVPRVLLKAYRMTRREDFLLAARDVILGWASYERSAVLPKGFLWNDHAIAERVLVLADFWAVYRHHSRYEARTAETILILAARSGRFLADPAHFTVATNHGVMQNLALWHLSLAFPLIPQSAAYRQLAFERLADQMGFYINEEGVVLEHSAWYQHAGLHFTSMAFRYMSLQGLHVASKLRDKYARAQEFYAALRRPDGSLPMIGDTSSRVDQQGPAVTSLDLEGRWRPIGHRPDWSPPREVFLLPIAGYSIWWDGLEGWPISDELSQTVVAWSYFPGHAHKHADEMSVLLWASGETWWTNVGYWPYGTAGRSDAESWNASNAPHLTHESTTSLRTTRVLTYGSRDGLRFIDLERRTPEGFTARRQVLHLNKSALWFVIDHSLGDPKDRVTTLWTTSPHVRTSEGKIPDSFELRSESTKAVLTAFLLGSPGTTSRIYKGSRSPFAGWQAADPIATPASAIMVERPASDSWTSVIWSLDRGRPGVPRLTARPSMSAWEGSESWTITLAADSGSIRISREQDSVVVADDGANNRIRLVLTRPEGIDERISGILDAHERVLGKYPTFNEVIDYRVKATLLSILVLVLQEAFLLCCKRLKREYYLPIRALSVLAWSALAVWLVVIRVRLI